MGAIRIACNTRILLKRSERKKLLGRTRRMQENDIKINLSEIENDDVDWIYLA
jgi:hypothetical protein